MKLLRTSVLAGLAVAAGALIATAGASPDQQPAQRQTVSVERAADAAPSQLLAAREFAVLRDPSKSADALGMAPGDVDRLRRGFIELTSGEPTVTAWSNRTSRGDAVVQASDSDVCLTVRHRPAGGSSGCAPATNATNPDTPIVSVTAIGDGQTAVTALFVDRTSDVALDGRPVVLEGNVAATVVDGRPSTLSWTTPKGNQRRLDLANAR